MDKEGKLMDEKQKHVLKTIIKKAKERSPNYPGIALETALEKARILREREGKRYAPSETVLHHWGYVPKSSGGLVALSALKKFGLIDDQGKGSNRRIKLSDLALRILLDDREESTERNEAIKQAALNPVIHQKLWNQYGAELPSDDNLLVTLRRDEGFTDNAAKDLIKEYRSTIELAKLKGSDIMSGHEEDKFVKKEDRNIMSNDSLNGLQSSLKKPIIEMPIPVSPTELVVMKIPYPLSEEGWKQLLTILPMYKPGLVVQPIQPKDETKES